MSKVTGSTDFDRLKPEELQKFLANYATEVSTVLNGNLDFATNFNGKLLSISFGAANTDSSVAHGLGRVPAGYIVYKSSASLAVYDGAVASNASTLTLRASAAGTVSLICF